MAKQMVYWKSDWPICRNVIFFMHNNFSYFFIPREMRIDKLTINKGQEANARIISVKITKGVISSARVVYIYEGKEKEASFTFIKLFESYHKGDFIRVKYLYEKDINKVVPANRKIVNYYFYYGLLILGLIMFGIGFLLFLWIVVGQVLGFLKIIIK